MSSTTARHLQESSGRQTFGSFHIVSPSFDPCHASLVAEPVRSAMEDCFRIVFRDDCSWETSYVGLGNAECRGDDENDSSKNSNSSNDTVTIVGGVIDFVDATTIPSTSEVVDCLDMALQSTTCLVSIQSYFPTIDQIRYEYLSEGIGAPAPTFPPIVSTTESDDNLMSSSSSSSSATTPNQDDTNTSSSSQLIIPLAVVGSCAIFVAILGFLFVSRMAAHRSSSSSSKQRTSSSTEIQDITTSSIVTDDPDGNRSDEADMEIGIEATNHDDDANGESTTITDYDQLTHTREEERTTISYQDLCRDDLSPTTCFSGHVVEDAAVMTHGSTATMKINHTHEPDDTMGYVSSDSEHHSDDEDLEAVVLPPQESTTPGTSKSNPILLVPSLQYYLQKSTDNVEAPHDIAPCRHEANHVRERHGESSWNKDGRSTLPGAPFVVENNDHGEDDEDNDDEDFALDYSWDPDDDSTTAMLEDEDSFSVTKTQVVPLLSTTTQHTQRRRRRRTNHPTSQKSFSISPRRRPHVVTPSSSHYHDPIPPSAPQNDESNHPSLTDAQFRRSRSFVIVLPTSSSPSCGDDPARRCRSAPRPVVGR